MQQIFSPKTTLLSEIKVIVFVHGLLTLMNSHVCVAQMLIPNAKTLAQLANFDKVVIGWDKHQTWPFQHFSQAQIIRLLGSRTHHLRLLCQCTLSGAQSGVSPDVNEYSGELAQLQTRNICSRSEWINYMSHMCQAYRGIMGTVCVCVGGGS